MIPFRINKEFKKYRAENANKKFKLCLAALCEQSMLSHARLASALSSSSQLAIGGRGLGFCTKLFSCQTICFNDQREITSKKTSLGLFTCANQLVIGVNLASNLLQTVFVFSWTQVYHSQLSTFILVSSPSGL